MPSHLQKIARFWRELFTREDLDGFSPGPEVEDDRFRLSFFRYLFEPETLPGRKHSSLDRPHSDLTLAYLFGREELPHPDGAGSPGIEPPNRTTRTLLSEFLGSETLPPAPPGDLPPRRSFTRWLLSREKLPHPSEFES